MKNLFFGILLFALTACAGPGGPASGPERIDQAELITQLVQLPGVLVLDRERGQFCYPDQRMFGTGAVLPLPGGPKLLDPLAQFLRLYPTLNWQVEILAHTGHGSAYDQRLAEKRSELLASYLLGKGVAVENLSFKPQAATGQQLVFTLLLPPEAATR